MKIVRVVKVLAWKALRQSDRKRWVDPDNLETWWDTRTERMAQFIPKTSRVIEFGAGRRQLEKFLDKSCTYVPSDLVDRGPGTFICDLNQRPLPNLRHIGADVAFFAGVLEYIHDVKSVIEWLSEQVSFCVASYTYVSPTPSIIRRLREKLIRLHHGYMNDYTEKELLDLFREHGFVRTAEDAWTSQRIYLFLNRGARSHLNLCENAHVSRPRIITGKTHVNILESRGYTPMNLIAPFGFYGAGNIGDEATLQGFARLVSRYKNTGSHVWVASRDPAHTKRVEPSFRYFKAVGRDPRRRWARFRSNACVIPGGTPIMDVLGEWPLSEVAPLIQAARGQGKPVLFVGSGTERLIREESKCILRNVIAPNVLGWSVRCERDKERLIEYGVPGEQITVAADLAWLLDAVSPRFGKEYLSSLKIESGSGLVGININNESFIHEKEPRFFEKLAEFLDATIERFDYRILFLCHEVREDDMFDKFASQKVLDFMRCRDKAYLVPNNYWAPQNMLSLIGCCSLTIGTRYHFCLFSALQNVPFIAIKRSDKVDDLCWDMNWPYGLPLTAIDRSNLLEMLLEVRQRAESLEGFLKERVQVMKQRVSKNAIPLSALNALMT